MSPEKQRKAIQEACGWEFCNYTRYAMCYIPSVGFVGDPLDDLNAMQQAEKALSDDQFYKYASEHLPSVVGDTCPVRATAAQRAEAFLRTIGKWEELQP